LSSRFVRNSFFGTITAIISTLGNFLSGLIVARMLGLEGVGAYSFVIWVVSVVTTVTGAGLPLTLTRYLPELADFAQGRQAKRVAVFLLRPALVFNAVPLIIFASYGLWLIAHKETGSVPQDGSFNDPVLCVLAGACCTAQAIGDFSKAYLRGVHQFDRMAKLIWIAVTSQLVTIAIGSLLFGVRGALAGYLVGAVLPMLPLRDFWGVNAEATLELRRRVFKYAKFRWVSEIAAAFVFSRIEVFFLQVFWGVQSVGLLTASLTLANLAVQGPLMLTWGLLPHFSERFDRRDMASLRSAYSAGTRLMGFLIFPACFGLAALVPELLPRLYGAAFATAVPSAMVLVCAASVSATATVGANLIWAMERTDVDLYLSVVGAVLSITGGLLLIAPMGVMGAAFSRAITQFIVIGLGTWFLGARLGFSIPFGALAKLMIAALFCAAAARGCLVLVPGWVGIAMAIPFSAAVYVLAVRIMKGLEPEDIEKLRTLMRYLPLPLRGATAQRLMSFALG
jgi:O-antigen/teichoic acid export membrane protein